MEQEKIKQILETRIFRGGNETIQYFNSVVDGEIFHVTNDSAYESKLNSIVVNDIYTTPVYITPMYIASIKRDLELKRKIIKAMVPTSKKWSGDWTSVVDGRLYRITTDKEHLMDSVIPMCWKTLQPLNISELDGHFIWEFSSAELEAQHYELTNKEGWIKKYQEEEKELLSKIVESKISIEGTEFFSASTSDATYILVNEKDLVENWLTTRNYFYYENYYVRMLSFNETIEDAIKDIHNHNNKHDKVTGELIEEGLPF